MASKLLRQLEEIKRRQSAISVVSCYSSEAVRQAHTLEHRMKSVRRKDLEIWKFFVIGMVTCLENGVRDCVESLIDSGPPFSTNASALADRVTLRVDDVLFMQGKALSVGSLIAHVVPVNSINDIDNVLSALLGESDKRKSRKFLQELRQAVKPDDGFSDHPALSGPLIKEPDKVIAGVKELFRLRHIFVHELHDESMVDPKNVQQLFSAGLSFLEGMNSFIQTTIHPGYSASTQAGMNVGVYQTLSQATAEMEQCLAELKVRLSTGEKRKLTKAQSAWEAYLEQEMKFSLNPYKGGTASPLFDGPARTRLVQQRTEILQRHHGVKDWTDTL